MNTGYRIPSFTKKKQLLLCVNSSGTAMNTMSLHHQLCYGPSFIETWNLEEHAMIIQELWNKINLYESTRGVNRFIALHLMLKRINRIFIPHSSFDSLEHWITSTTNISTAALECEIKHNPDPLLLKALRWSKLINQKMESINLIDKPPFEFVRESLEKASVHFDIAIISGSSQERIIDEWKQHDLLKYVSVIGSQEEGSKSECIANLIKKGYTPNNVLMIGDVLSDYEAAVENQAQFYPIITHDEISSWSILHDYYLDKFTTGTFAQFQEALVSMFKDNFVIKVFEHTKTLVTA